MLVQSMLHGRNTCAFYGYTTKYVWIKGRILEWLRISTRYLINCDGPLMVLIDLYLRELHAIEIVVAGGLT